MRSIAARRRSVELGLFSGSFWITWTAWPSGGFKPKSVARRSAIRTKSAPDATSRSTIALSRKASSSSSSRDNSNASVRFRLPVAVDLDGMMIQDRVHFSDRAAVIIGNAPHALVDDQVLALLIHGRKAYHLPRALRTRMRRSRSCTTLLR